jgi:hypothetical protein
MAANRKISARSADPFAINAKGKDEKGFQGGCIHHRAKALRGGWPHPANRSVRRSFCRYQACHEANPNYPIQSLMIRPIHWPEQG